MSKEHFSRIGNISVFSLFTLNYLRPGSTKNSNGWETNQIITTVVTGVVFFAQELAWREQDPEVRKLGFLPRKYDSLRKVPAYSDFITERFQRCLDLYLCPRQRKMRVRFCGLVVHSFCALNAERGESHPLCVRENANWNRLKIYYGCEFATKRGAVCVPLANKL